MMRKGLTRRGLLTGASSLAGVAPAAAMSGAVKRAVLFGSAKAAPTIWAPRAQTLLSVLNAASAIPNATGNDVPTITVGTAGAGSTLNAAGVGAPSVKCTDATVIPISQVVVLNGSNLGRTNGYNANNGLLGRGNGWGLKIKINATAFDVSTFGFGPIRVKVNGAWTAVSGNSDFTQRYIKYTFPTKAVRDIEVYFTSGDAVGGFNVAAGDAFQTPAAFTQPRGLIFGDSYIADESHSSTSAPHGSFPAQFAEAIGVPDLGFSGIGGQGYATIDATYSKSFMDRIAANDLTQRTNLDFVILYNSINDRDKTVATVKANIKSAIASVKIAHPNAFVWGFTGFKTSDYTIDAAHNSAFVSAFTESIDSHGVGVWDGNDQIIQVGVNDATYIDTDNIHLNAAGATFASGIVAGKFKAFLQSVS